MSMVYFKILTCQNRQCVHKTLMILHFDSTVIRLDLEKTPFDINLRKFA